MRAMVRGPNRMALFASLAVVCTTVGSVAPARAQDDTGRPPAAPPAAAKDDERMTEARKQFQAGVNLLDDPDGANTSLLTTPFIEPMSCRIRPKCSETSVSARCTSSVTVRRSMPIRCTCATRPT